MAKVVCPDSGQLLITVPVSECGLAEDFAISVARENFFRDVAWLLNIEGAGMIGVSGDFPRASHIQHTLKARLYR